MPAWVGCFFCLFCGLSYRYFFWTVDSCCRTSQLQCNKMAAAPSGAVFTADLHL